MFKPKNNVSGTRMSNKYKCQNRDSVGGSSTALCTECTKLSTSQHKEKKLNEQSPIYNNTSTSKSTDAAASISGIKDMEQPTKLDTQLDDTTLSQDRSCTSVNIEEIKKMIESEDQKLASFSSWTRFRCPRNSHLTKIESLKLPFGLEFPDRCYDKVLESITKHFDLEQGKGDLFSTFKSLEDSQEYFVKKFGYLWNEELNIMQFDYPEFLKETTTMKTLNDSEIINCNMTWRSIKKLISGDWLDDVAINFVMDVFNLFLESETKKGSMPEIVFGRTYDVANVVPSYSSKKDNVLVDGLDLSIDDRDSDLVEQFVQEMGKWYVLRPKGRLGKLIDYSDDTNMSVKQYGTVLNVSGDHWIYLKYMSRYLDLEKHKDPVPCVMTYDALHIDTEAALDIRRWYAKYFGLINKQILCGGESLTKTDFNGLDMMMVDDFKFPETFYANNYPSITEVEVMKVPCAQTDPNNCGIIALIKAWEDVVGVSYTESFLDAKDPLAMFNKFIQRFRLSILSLIDDIFDLLHGDSYNMFSHILTLDKANVVPYSRSNKDMVKWCRINEMFDKGHYKFDEENLNPNSIFSQQSFKKIEREYKSMSTMSQTSIGSKRKIEKSGLTQPSQTKKVRVDIKEDDDDTVTDEENDTNLLGPRKLSLTTKGKVVKKKKSLKQQSKEKMNNLPRCSPFTDAQMTRTIFYHNISNKKITMDIVRDVRMENMVHYYHPTKVVTMVLSHLRKRFILRKKYKGESLSSIMLRTSTRLQSLMKNFYTFFLVDKKTDRSTTLTHKKKVISSEGTNNNHQFDKYEIKASMIIEPVIELNKTQVCMIHFLSVDFGTEQSRAVRSFLYHIFKDPSFRDMQVYVVSNNPDYEYNGTDPNNHKDVSTIEQIASRYDQMLLKYGFQKDSSINFDDLLVKGSKVMRASASKIRSYCSGDYTTDSVNQCYRVLMLNDRDKTHVRYNDDSREFSMYSHPFGWSTCTNSDLEYISDSNRRQYMKQPNIEYVIKSGGHREDNTPKGLVLEDRKEEKFEPLLKQFLQHELNTKTKRQSTCTWLSACLIANELDEIEARRMLSLLMEHPDKYEWMHMFRLPKGHQTSGETLVQILEKNTPFRLEHVRGPALVKDRLNYMLSNKMNGKYVCQILTNANVYKHVVGVDCDKGWIYDCLENTKLPLTKESFDKCCGPHQNGIQGIKYWGKFVLKPRKKQNK